MRWNNSRGPLELPQWPPGHWDYTFADHSLPLAPGALKVTVIILLYCSRNNAISEWTAWRRKMTRWTSHELVTKYYIHNILDYMDLIKKVKWLVKLWHTTFWKIGCRLVLSSVSSLHESRLEFKGIVGRWPILYITKKRWSSSSTCCTRSMEQYFFFSSHIYVWNSRQFYYSSFVCIIKLHTKYSICYDRMLLGTFCVCTLCCAGLINIMRSFSRDTVTGSLVKLSGINGSSWCLCSHRHFWLP